MTADELNDALVAVMNAKTGRTDTLAATALPYYMDAFNSDANDYADAQVSNEVTNRNTAIAAAIATEVTNRNTAIAAAIATEVSNRNTAISAAIATEVTNRNTAIETAIAEEVVNRNAYVGSAIDTEIAARNSAIDAAIATEVTDRDEAIAAAIATEVTDRNDAIEAAAFEAEAAGGVATARSASELNAFKAQCNTLAEECALIPGVDVTRLQGRITHIIFDPSELDVDVTTSTLTNVYETLTEATKIAEINALKSAALAYNNMLPPDNEIDVDYAM